MPNPILAITDGTTRISLITRPWQLEDWTAQTASIKEGGIRRGSPLSDGTRLVDYSYANVIDTFTLKAMHGEQDGVIRTLQELRRLLEKGRRYWVDEWATEPVWIEARGSEETNTRYAVIKDWLLPGDDNPYAQPLFAHQDEAVADDLVLTLEHDFWQADEPGTSTSIETSGQQVYNAVTYGRAATTTQEVYVANKHNLANLTHIWTWTSPGGPFGGNLIGAALPFDIFTGGAAGPANADQTYFGCNTALADSGPFDNLVFDILTAATYGAGDSTTWEYWNGAWVALTVFDNTMALGPPPDGSASFEVTGVNSIHWEPPTDWVPVAVNAITAYWVRVVITEATAVTRAQQQNRDIYSCVWPRFDVDELQITGDLPALLRVKIRGRSADPSGGGVLDVGPNRALLSLRSLSRGTSFSPYINLSTEQNPSAVAAATPGPNMAAVVDTRAPSGIAWQYSVAGVTALTREGQISITGGTAIQWFGQYHWYLRYRATAGTGEEVRIEFRIRASNTNFSTGLFNLQSNNEYQVLDIGRQSLPPFPLAFSTDRPQITIDVYIETTAAGVHTVTFYDLVLMPVDEWFGMFEQNVDTNLLAGSALEPALDLDIDAIRFPKRLLTYLRNRTGTQAIEEQYVGYSAKRPFFQANADQRLWFMFMQSDPATNVVRWSPPFHTASVQAEVGARYQSMRGAR